MAQRFLTAQPRDKTGSAASRRMRRQGRIPAVVYGHTENRLVFVDEKEFAHAFKTVSESTLITLKLPTGDLNVLVKDYQRNLVAGRVEHLDFYEVDSTKTLRTHVRVKLVGLPVGVREGGVLETTAHELEIECLPKDLPEEIVVDVSPLQLAHSMHVRDLTPPPGVTFRAAGDQTVCLVAVHKVVEEKPAAEAAEVAGEGVAEGEAPAAAGATSESAKKTAD
jgi:large subunit ribosomal protein L25